jgi:hypothetical protein
MVTGCPRSVRLVNTPLLLQQIVVFVELSVMFLIQSMLFALCSKVLVVSSRLWLK